MSEEPKRADHAELRLAFLQAMNDTSSRGAVLLFLLVPMAIFVAALCAWYVRVAQVAWHEKPVQPRVAWQGKPHGCEYDIRGTLKFSVCVFCLNFLELFS